MPKLKITVGSKVTYSDSSGREYKGPLKDAPDYVKKAAEEMDTLLRSVDKTFANLLHGDLRDRVSTSTYKMKITRSWDWMPIIILLTALITVAFVLLFKWAS